MDIIIGASGQVGSAVVHHLIQKGHSVRGIIRNEKKASALQQLGAETAVADLYDGPSLSAACQGGHTLFVITPETGQEQDLLGATKQILHNCRQAAESAGIKKIVGLSSIGAQHAQGTGNLVMSYMLEHAFDGLPAQQIFIRPAYYFSNWLLYLPMVKEQRVLPTFFPPDLRVNMISPMDVAAFAANVIMMEADTERIFELTGPDAYSSADVAEAFAAALNIPVRVEQTPQGQWAGVLQQAGFSPDAVKQFSEMTVAVITGKAVPEKEGVITVEGGSTLQEYIHNAVQQQA